MSGYYGAKFLCQTMEEQYELPFHKKLINVNFFSYHLPYLQVHGLFFCYNGNEK